MPTKEKKVKTHTNKVRLAMLDQATINASPAIKSRLHKPSAIGESLSKKHLYNWRGLTFDQNGQAVKPKTVDALQASNQEIHNAKLVTVRKLFSTYQGIWQLRSAAKQIAFDTGCHADTIRRYIRIFPEGI